VNRPPRVGAGAAAYPVLLTEDDKRRDVALATWNGLLTGTDKAIEPLLQPVTATVRGLPATTSAYLPKVGTSMPMTEEETRESLRLFLVSASSLIGATPEQLSLVERTDHADGTKSARYEQRPSRYPLRGGYGVLQITFAADRRLLDVSSTCIPDIENLQLAITNIPLQFTADAAVQHIVNRPLTYTDARSGGERTLNVAPSDAATARELVLYPRLRLNGNPQALELHLCWEIAVGSGDATTTRRVYLDAVTGEIINVE
jgi:hypothetical protein